MLFVRSAWAFCKGLPYWTTKTAVYGSAPGQQLEGPTDRRKLATRKSKRSVASFKLPLIAVKGRTCDLEVENKPERKEISITESQLRNSQTQMVSECLEWVDWDSSDVDENDCGDVLEFNKSHVQSTNELCIQGEINGTPTDILVDTGAGQTLISEWHATVELGLNPVDDKKETGLVGAGGSPLDVRGSVNVQFKVGNACFSHTVMVVRGLQCDCILGRDVLRNIPCKIESNGETIYFSIESEQIPSKVEPFAKLVLKRKLKIPGNHEMLVNAKVRRLGGQTIPDIAMVERNYDLLRHQGLMVASTCVSMDNDSVVVRNSQPYT